MNATTQQRYWSFPRMLFGDLTALMVMTWVGFTITVMGIAIAIDYWGSLDVSVWEEAARLPQWFVLFMGVHLGSEHLPRNIAYGKTRRDTFIEMSLFMFPYSALTALLLTIGWVIERAVYNVIDVEQVIEDRHMFSSVTDYPVIFLELFLVMAIWIVGGLFISAAYYRYGSDGLLAIIPALLVASLAELGMGSTWGPLGPIMRSLFGSPDPPLLVSLILAAAGIVALLGMAWAVIRDIPLQKPSA